MRRDFLRDRPPRPWDGGSFWSNLSLSVDEPKRKPGETSIPVSGEVRLQLANALARKGFLRHSQVDQKDSTAIFNGMISALEDKIYGGVRAMRK